MHILVKQLKTKVKEKKFKGNQRSTHYLRKIKSKTADFSSETVRARHSGTVSECHNGCQASGQEGYPKKSDQRKMMNWNSVSASHQNTILKQ